ncbi:MAG: protein kinase [Deltaproteobacteria bacterium]|nr:protein kinase [Deltaproteobacteria bacterium]
MTRQGREATRRNSEDAAERFQVLGRLGRGGMASVYRAFDRAANKEVALKRLSPKACDNPYTASLFEQEFHTLAQLAHPRIIEVYDFGVDSVGAYYTMELLDGADFRQLAPLDWKTSCKLLRDVASSLALIHSRRLLHRDVSSRNLRCTNDGRAKLIDFGAMAPFGTPIKVIGTPAFVAPEALNHQPLDQRTDLFALGALAYWLMTKRHAYRARSLAHLQDAWRTQPPALSELNPEIPAALNDLVMSLLSLDRMARPFNAAEVAEKLEACAGLERDDTLEVRQAYLTTPRLVGREALVTDLRRLTFDVLGNRGGRTLVFEGISGIGRSRLLAELVLEGKVVGVLVLAAQAEAGPRSAYGVAWRLIEQLLENAYDIAVEAIRPHDEVLDAVFPNLASTAMSRQSYGKEGLLASETNPAEWEEEAETSSQDDRTSSAESEPVNNKPDLVVERASIQKALLDLFLLVSKRRRLLIAVDDIHRVDEPSAALLSALALKSKERGFILAVTMETEVEPIAPDACALLSEVARHIAIKALDLSASEALLRSIFGDVANVRLLADRIYAISKGNPRATIGLAQHLVDQGRVRYQAGAWTLPDNIDAGSLPGSITEALAARASKLSAGARALAQRVALAADQHFSFDECLLLSGHQEVARLTSELNELVAYDVLTKDESFYQLSQTGWVLPLTKTLDAVARRTAHLVLAALFESRDEQFLLVQQLFRAGHDARALDLLVRHADEMRQRLEVDLTAYTEYILSLPKDWAETCRDALKLCERLARPKRESYMLRSFLVRASFSTGVYDWVHFSEVFSLLYHESGLDIYYELDGEPNSLERLSQALKLAQHRYDNTAESERVLPPLEAIRRLALYTIVANSFASISYDNQLLDSSPSLEPFRPLSPTIGTVQLHTLAARCAVGARFEKTRETYQRIVNAIAQPDHEDINKTTRSILRFSLIYGIGTIDAAIGLDTALKAADELEPYPLNQVNAWRIRMIYYLRRGEARQAERCRRTIELLQIQNSPSQTFETVHVFTALVSYASYDDLNGVVQMTEGIERNARRFPGWVPFVYYARGEYHRIRGDFVQSSREFEHALGLISPGRHAAWPFAAGAYLRTLFDQGRLSDGERLGREYLIAAQREDLGYPVNLIRMPLALIEARLGKQRSAQDLADEAVMSWKALGATGVYLGLAYETRARVAIYNDDPQSFRLYAAQCGELWRTGENPSLIAKHEKLMQDARQAYLGMSQEVKQASELADILSKSGDMVSAVRAHLAEYQSYDAVIEGALDLLIKRTGGKEGYLYLLRKGELALVARKASKAIPQQAIEATKEAFARSMGDDDATDASETHTETDLYHTTDAEAWVYEPIVLSVKVEGLRTPIGVFVLALKNHGVYRPDGVFFRAVAFCLLEAERKGVSAAPNKATIARRELLERRYVLEGLIGEGGMASVYKARDRASGKSIALKRARTASQSPNGKTTRPEERSDRKKNLEIALRREYQTLKSLAHPRIVEVYEFGLDQDGPYYTMELLEGTDLSQLAPLEWRNACAFLRDIASALALLHSRRLLHRDVSPRNVRITTNGQAKLMDFGALSPMGLPKSRVGTPPFIPPESIYGQPLDQRSDLYSLGALAYWLLTGRQAYRVRTSKDLRNAWRTRPPLPSEIVVKLDALDAIPDTLDRLVMSLLSFNPLARPVSAAEVIERLSAIAGLPMQEQLAVPQAYLSAPMLVGRERALLTIKKCIIRSLRRRSRAILVEGSAGVGRTRFLDACVMEAKLAGLIVLRAEALDARSGDYSVVKALINQLREEIPVVISEEAQPYRSVLAPVFPKLFAARSEDIGPELTPRAEAGQASRKSVEIQSFRSQIQNALSACLRAVSRRRALAIAVDDFHRIDETSAASLALLSQEITDERLMVAVSVENAAACVSQQALDLIRQKAKTIEITDLDRAQTETLLISVFGEVPNVRLIANQLYAVYHGNPRDLMRIAQHLVDRGLARYQAGSWSLPDGVEPGDLPSHITAALKARLDRLSDDARSLARTWALIPDRLLSTDECQVLAGHESCDQLIASLNDLVADEILSVDGKYYGFSQQQWAAALLDELDENDKPRRHERIARLFERRGNDAFGYARHLLHAGKEEEALEVFVEHVKDSRSFLQQSTQDLADFVSAAPRNWEETINALLAICDKLNKSKWYRSNLQYFYVILSALFPGAERGHTLTLAEQLSRDAGLDDYQRLSEIADPLERLKRALDLAQQRYDSSLRGDRFLPPGEAIQELARLVITTIAITAILFDYHLLESMPSLEPLYLISPAMRIIDQNVRATLALVGARFEQARRGYLEILEQIERPDHAGLPEEYVLNVMLNITRAIGTIEAGWGLSSALSRAERLEKHPKYEIGGRRLRMLYYLRQGDAQNADACKRKIEILQIKNSPAQFFEGTQLSSEVFVYSLSDDLMGLKRDIENIEKMAERYKDWKPITHFARGEYQRIRGEYRAAIAELDTAIELTAPGRHLVWPYASAARIRARFEVRDLEKGLSEGRRDLAKAEEASLGYTCNYIRSALALLEAGLGSYDAAIKLADDAVRDWKRAGATGINLGLAYETRARIAVRMGDSESYISYSELCAEQYLDKHNPVLAAKYERLQQEAFKAEIDFTPRTDHRRDVEERKGEQTLYHKTKRQLSECTDASSRVRRVLEILVNQSHAESGYLFGLTKNGLEVLSSWDQEKAPDALVRFAKSYLASEIDDSNEATVTMADENAAQGTNGCFVLQANRVFEPVVLHGGKRDEWAVVGLAALTPVEKRLRAVDPDIVQAIGETMLDKGDVTNKPFAH